MAKNSVSLQYVERCSPKSVRNGAVKLCSPMLMRRITLRGGEIGGGEIGGDGCCHLLATAAGTQMPVLSSGTEQQNCSGGEEGVTANQGTRETSAHVTELSTA